MTLNRIPALLLSVLTLLVFTINAQEVLQGDIARQVISSAQTIRTSQISEIPEYIQFQEGKQTSVESNFSLIKKLYRLNDNYAFVLLNEHTDQLGNVHLRFQQTYLQKPIESGILIFHTKNDLVYAINGLAFNKTNLASNSSITEATAFATAKNHVGAQIYKWEVGEEEEHLKSETNNTEATYFPTGELTYIQPKLDKNELRLAYKFNIYAQHPVSRAEIYIDAITNEVIFENKIIKHIDVPGTAVTGYSGNRTITTDSTSPTNFRLRETGRGNGIQTFNMNEGTNYGAATDFTDTDNNWNNINPDLDQYATDAHWGSEMTYDYYDIEHNHNSIDNAGFLLKNYIHYDMAYNNAFWDGQRMTFGDGNGTTTTPLVALDITAHEVTHGLTNYTANLVYQDESGALNESFSDIFGTCIENFGRPNNWNWTIGEDIGNTIRSMSNPGIFNDPDTYMGNNWVPAGGPDNGGVHSNSGVQNFWFYLLTDGGSGTNDNGDTYSVTAQGFTIASKIAFRNLTVYLTVNSTFADARFYSIQSAIDLYGPCSPEVEATTNAWYAVGVGNPYVNYVLADFTVNDTVFCSAPVVASFQNQSINGTNFIWDFGDGTATSTDVNPNHTYTGIGDYDVTLIADGGSCGADTVVFNSFITVDTSIYCVVSLTNGTSAIQTACEGTLFDSGGGTGNYGDLENSEITIAPLGADSVRLDFISFSVEPGNGPTCNYDYLEVFDGNSNSAPLIGRYCNNNPPPASVTSTGNALTLVFHSDQALNFSGFQIDWQCYLSNFPPVANFESIDTISCSGNVSFTDLSTHGPTAWTWHFGDGNTSNLQNPIHSYAANGNYTVKLVTTNFVGSDSIEFVNYVNVDLLDAPLTMTDSICEGQSASLNVSISGIAKWYDAPVGGNEIATGSPFISPALNANTSYYVSDFIAGAPFSAGAISSAIGQGGYFNGDQSLIFDCTTACVLRTVAVNANSAGNRVIELRNSTGQVIESVTVNIPLGAQTITLNMPIPAGTNLQLGTAPGTTPDLFRNNTGAIFPYTSTNGIISITGTTATTAPTYYYFFYDWHVEMPACESPRSPFDIEVFSDFDLNITNAPEYGCEFQTSVPLMADVPNGTWSASCTNCIDANTGIFNPSQAGLGVWTISYTATNFCDKTVEAQISVETCLSVEENAISSINIYPNPSLNATTVMCNSEVIKSIVVTNVSGKVVSIIPVINTKTQIELSRFENGLYFFNFINDKDERLTSKKFVKQ